MIYLRRYEAVAQNIRNILIKVRNDFRKEFDCTLWQINNGYCVEFTEEVINRMGGYKKNLFELSSDMFYSDFPEDVKHLWGNVKHTKDGGLWSLDMLDLYGHPPIDLDYFSFGSHSWIFYDGKHYDAECINGVDKWYMLPLFDRAIRRGIRKMRKENDNQI